MKAWAVVLAGGVGSRFWPVSTPQRPKQLLPLVTGRPLLVDTLERMAPLADPAHTLVLTNSALVPAIEALGTGIPSSQLVAEPRPAGTAAALTWAANRIAEAAGPDAVMMSVHADWAVSDTNGYRAALRQATRLASERRSLVTVGVVPSRPESGFGYIRPGERLADVDWVEAYRVAQFVEKPDRARAAAMLREGYLWNSGIFVWRVGDYLEEVRRHCPEVAGALNDHGGDLAAFFANVKSIAVDVGVLERSDRVLVIPGDFGWDDIGTWAALRRVRRSDASGNALEGPVTAVASSGNVVHAEGNEVVLFGVSDLVVVTHDGLTLVTTIDRAADLKDLLEAVPARLRERQ